MLFRMRCAAALASAMLAVCSCANAFALDNRIIKPREDRTRADVRSGALAMPPYGASLHAEVLAQIRRTVLPFRIVEPARLMVMFGVNRRGELVQFKLVTKSGSKLIDDYAELMVRQASRRFPPPPANLPGDVLRFSIPISFR